MYSYFANLITIPAFLWVSLTNWFYRVVPGLFYRNIWSSTSIMMKKSYCECIRFRLIITITLWKSQSIHVHALCWFEMILNDKFGFCLEALLHFSPLTEPAFQILHYLGLDHVGHIGGRNRCSTLLISVEFSFVWFNDLIFCTFVWSFQCLDGPKTSRDGWGGEDDSYE